MEEIAFTMRLKPGVEAEYKRRHDEIWPELSTALREAGILAYAIYLDPASRTLFAVQQRTETHTVDQLPGLPVMQRWWDYMADLMDTNPDNSPVVQPLDCVYRM
jgi:L-rhamnose mutarotase